MQRDIPPRLNNSVPSHTLTVGKLPGSNAVHESTVRGIAVQWTTIRNSNQDAIGSPKEVVGSLAGLGHATFGRSAYIENSSKLNDQRLLWTKLVENAMRDWSVSVVSACLELEVGGILNRL